MQVSCTKLIQKIAKKQDCEHQVYYPANFIWVNVIKLWLAVSLSDGALFSLMRMAVPKSTSLLIVFPESEESLQSGSF